MKKKAGALQWARIQNVSYVILVGLFRIRKCESCDYSGFIFVCVGCSWFQNHLTAFRSC
jgi:hypothetical protein